MGPNAEQTPVRPAFVCPALVPAGAALAGILLCAGRNLTEYAVAAAVSLAVLLIFRKDRSHLHVFAFTLVLFYAWTWMLAPGTISPGERTLRGVCTDVRRYPASQRLIIETTDCGRVALIVTDIVPELSDGDIVELRTEICAPGRYDGIPFLGMESMLNRADRISGEGIVHDGEINIVGRDNSLLYRLSDFRRSLCDDVAAMPVSPGTARMLTTTFFGVRDLDPEIRDSFRLSGLAHLLCVSGFHVGLLAAFILFLIWPARIVRPWFPVRYLIAAALVWVYVLFIGFGPAAVRAAVMITVLALVRCFQRKPLPLNTLCVAFTAVLAIAPYRLFSAGFQLSFAAVAALLLLAPKLNFVPKRRKWSHRAMALLSIPLAALLGTVPVTLVWFHSVPLLSVPANALAVNVFPLFMGSGLMAFVLFQSGLPSGWVCWLTDRLYLVLTGISDGAAGLVDGIDLALYPGTAEVLAMVAVLAGLIVCLHMPLKRRIAAAVSAGCVIVCVGCSYVPHGPHIFIDGAGRRVDVAVVSGTRAEIFHCGHEAGNAAVRFCAAQGGNVGQTPLEGISLLKIGNERIRMLDSVCSDVVEPGDIVVVLGRKSSVVDVIERNPGHVVLSPRLDMEQRAEWTAACRDASVPCTDLRHTAFYREAVQ